MSEELEGILSETLLDKLASDLGVDPDDMRKHPFFRVLKGRILLTYPLRIAEALEYEYQAPIYTSETNPDNDAWYEALPETDLAEVYYVMSYHNFTEARTFDFKFTVDGITFTSSAVDITEAEERFHSIKAAYLAANATTLYGSTKMMANDMYPLRGKTVKFEWRTRELIDNDKYVKFGVHYGKKVAE